MLHGADRVRVTSAPRPRPELAQIYESVAIPIVVACITNPVLTATNMVGVKQIDAREKTIYLEAMVLSHISNLSNHVTQKESHAILVGYY